MERIEMFRTKDGGLFDSVEKAKDHVNDVTQQSIYTLIKKAAASSDAKGFIPNFGVQFTEHFFKNIDKLGQIVDFYRDNKEEGI